MLPFLSPQLQHPIAVYAYIDIKKKKLQVLLHVLYCDYY
jgi:hypothetical protein